VPEALTARLAAKSGPEAQRAEAVKIACETLARLREVKGLRGFAFCGPDALAVLDASGTGGV